MLVLCFCPIDGSPDFRPLLHFLEIMHRQIHMKRYRGATVFARLHYLRGSYAVVALRCRGIGSTYYFFIIIIIIIGHETTAAAHWALLFIVRALFDDTITIAVWTGFHGVLSHRRSLRRRGAWRGRARQGAQVQAAIALSNQ